MITITVLILGTIQTIFKLLEKNYTKNESFAQLMGLCAGIMDICFYLGPMVLAAIMFCKLPSFQDTIYIDKEMKFIVIGLIMASLLYFGCTVFAVMNPDSLWIQLISARLLPGFIAICTAFVMSFLSTFLILRFLNRGDEMIMTKFHAAPRDEPPELSKSRSIGGAASVSRSRKDSRSYNIRDIQLPAILNDDGLYDLFMYHLMSEFSMECLLAFTEFEQYRSTCHDVFGMELQSMGDMRNVILAENIPKSAIVYGDDGDINNENNNDHGKNIQKCNTMMQFGINSDDKLSLFKLKAYRLYIKYIAVGSEFEINISYTERNRLMSMMDDQEKWMSKDTQIDINKLGNLFQNCCDQIYGLMNDSSIRFKSTKEFKKYATRKHRRVKSISVLTANQIQMNNNTASPASPSSPSSPSLPSPGNDNNDGPRRSSTGLFLAPWKG